MTERPTMTVYGFVLSSPDPLALAQFYHRLLGWPIGVDEPGWAKLTPPDGTGRGLSFHGEEKYVRPTWPTETGEQLMMMHLDIGTDDMESAVAYAVEAGATLADHQPQDDVRVLLDPDGHPFCLFPTG